jgi:hypothetical protein
MRVKIHQFSRESCFKSKYVKLSRDRLCGRSTLKTVIVVRAGNLSITDHLAEMRAWFAEHSIDCGELTMLHVLNFRVVFRASFATIRDADRFAEHFG